MNIEDNNLNLIKKWRHKAELCRYANSRLKEEQQRFYNYQKLAIIIVSLILMVVVGLYFRELIQENWVLVTMFSLPVVTILLESLENRVFHWSDNAKKYAMGVQIWGDWIKKADYIEELYSSSIPREKVKNLHKQYMKCMNNAPQIPNRKFLKYKTEYRIHRLKSQEIDGMNLDELQNTWIWKSRRKQ